MPMTEDERKARRERFEEARANYLLMNDLYWILNADKRRFSRNDCGIEPLQGYELAFQDTERKLKRTRMLMQKFRGEMEENAGYFVSREPD